jgi:hypothetical protein
MAERKVAGHALSSSIVASWGHGCVRPPSPVVDACRVDLHG